MKKNPNNRITSGLPKPEPATASLAQPP